MGGTPIQNHMQSILGKRFDMLWILPAKCYMDIEKTSSDETHPLTYEQTFSWRQTRKASDVSQSFIGWLVLRSQSNFVCHFIPRLTSLWERSIAQLWLTRVLVLPATLVEVSSEIRTIFGFSGLMLIRSGEKLTVVELIVAAPSVVKKIFLFALSVKII